jgi:UPF0755 protein
MRRLGSFLVLTVVVLAGLAVYVWYDLHRPAAPPGGAVVVTVPPGAPFRAVAAQLHRAGVLRHPLPLAAWARWTAQDRLIHRGAHRLDRPHSPLELLAALRSSAGMVQHVTIPEGYTAAQIAALLEKKGFGGRDVFACAMRDAALLRALDLPPSGVEGYLFPDTYAWTWELEPVAIVRALVERFRAESAALAARREAAGLSEHAMVTLASIVEKETGRASERPLIAGVFHNRLRRGIPLQSDPTVIYGLRDFDGNLRRPDLDDPSPYNTYVHRGLPPGPIANPGRAALEAAVSPASTAALYFVARNDGSHEFSTSLVEHNRAVQRYQRGGSRRP